MHIKKLLLLTLITYSHTAFCAGAALETQDPAKITYQLTKSRFFKSTNFCPSTDGYESKNLKHVVIIGERQDPEAKTKTGVLFHLKNARCPNTTEIVFPAAGDYKAIFKTHIAAIGVILANNLFSNEDRIATLIDFLKNLYIPEPTTDNQNPASYPKIKETFRNEIPQITDFVKNIADLQEEYLQKLMQAGVYTGELDNYKKYFGKGSEQPDGLKKEPCLKRNSLNGDQKDTSKRPAIRDDEESSVTAEPSSFELSDDLKRMMKQHPEKFRSSHSHSVTGSSALIQ